MRRHGAFTLVELVLAVSVILALVTLSLPSFLAARQQALLAKCAMSMRTLACGLSQYAVENRNCLPPFAFSEIKQPTLALSGHWGGSDSSDPTNFGRQAMDIMNLWALVKQSYVVPSALACPAADSALLKTQASLFPYTPQFSTYCMRFPSSPDLFAAASGLANYGGATKPLLNIYLMSAGGQSAPVGTSWQVIRLVRRDRVYAIEPTVACGDGNFDPASDGILADSFWYQDYRQTKPASSKAAFDVRAAWCHQRRFNVAAGDGAVRTVGDDGTVAANTLPPGGSLPDDKNYYATYAEKIWQFFDKTK